MRVFFPRISFTLDYGKNTHSGDITMISLGYGLHQAWIFCAMFGSSSLFMEEGLLAGESLFGIPTASFVSLLAYFLCLFVEGFTDQKYKAFYRKKTTIICSAFLMCVGTFLYFVQIENETICFIVHVIAGITTGFGSSILLLAWGVRFARGSVSSIHANSIIGFSLAFSIYITIVTVFGFPFGGVITALLPLGELSILLKHQAFGIGKNTDKQLFSPLPVRMSQFVAKFAVPILIFSIALGFLRLVSIHPNAEIGLPYSILSVGIAAVVLFVVTLLLPAQDDGWSFDFKIIGLFVAVAIAAVSFGGHEQTLLQSVTALIAYLCFEGLLWIYFSEFSQTFRLSPVLIFGVGRGCAGLATASVAIVNALSSSVYNADILSDTTFSIIMLIVLMASYLLLPSQTEIKKILQPSGLQVSIAKTENLINQNNSEVEGENNGFENMSGEGANSARTTNETQVLNATATVPTSSTNASSTSNIIGHNTGEGASGYQTNAGVINGSKTIGERTNGAANSMQNTNGANNTQDAPVKHIAKFKEKCQIIGNTYMLSLREQEVLFFLAKGYNAALIQEKLYISEGTTKTHMRHIYRKLNIHTQQDLIRIVESVELPKQTYK
jgi:DNA-binding CsgD family transcriptional regulator